MGAGVDDRTVANEDVGARDVPDGRIHGDEMGTRDDEVGSFREHDHLKKKAVDRIRPTATTSRRRWREGTRRARTTPLRPPARPASDMTATGPHCTGPNTAKHRAETRPTTSDRAPLT